MQLTKTEVLKFLYDDIVSKVSPNYDYAFIDGIAMMSLFRGYRSIGGIDMLVGSNMDCEAIINSILPTLKNMVRSGIISSYDLTDGTRVELCKRGKTKHDPFSYISMIPMHDKYPIYAVKNRFASPEILLENAVAIMYESLNIISLNIGYLYDMYLMNRVKDVTIDMEIFNRYAKANNLYLLDLATTETMSAEESNILKQQVEKMLVDPDIVNTAFVEKEKLSYKKVLEAMMDTLDFVREEM